MTAVTSGSGPTLLERLAETYNFEGPEDRGRVFVRILADELRARFSAGATVLDIGCGRGIGTHPSELQPLRAVASRMIGLEPDPDVAPTHGSFDEFHHATMEEAMARGLVAPGSVHLAYSYLVMEHVADPVAFLGAVYEALAPGGEYVFLTVNGAHYFTRIARLLHTLRIDEWILRIVRGAEAESYHYPVQYRCNRVAEIRELALRSGFEAPTIAYMERQDVSMYLKGPLRPVYHALAWKRRVLRDPTSLLDLVARVRKPDSVKAAG